MTAQGAGGMTVQPETPCARGLGAEPSPNAPDPRDAHRVAAAKRMRLCRERRRDGMRVIPFHIRESEITGLVRRGLLAREAAEDRDAIAKALGRFLDHVLRP